MNKILDHLRSYCACCAHVIRYTVACEVKINVCIHDRKIINLILSVSGEGTPFCFYHCVKQIWGKSAKHIDVPNAKYTKY